MIPTAPPAHDQADQLREWLTAHPEHRPTDDPSVAADRLQELAASGLLALPRPGGGGTATRFAALAAIGTADLTLGRLAEAHADAAAILSELAGPPARPRQMWGVWAAEPPDARVLAERRPDGEWRLNGRKAWCSGAGIYTHALITAHAVDGSRLFAVDLAAAGVVPVDGSWAGLALTGADTRAVDLHDVAALAIGNPGDYVGRPGFWHGAVGVAAVWYGGAVAVARRLGAAAAARPPSDLLLAHLGAVDVALGAAHAGLQAAAAAIDADPGDAGAAAVVARRTRGIVEASATEVIDRVGRALGAAPLALDRLHARRVADLALYLRQSHAEVDLADLGRRIAERGDAW